jgi:hypothetical protein
MAQQPTTASVPAKPNMGATAGIVRQEFGALESVNVVEQAAQAIAARETALVQARFVMALQRKRDLENVRVLLKQACGIYGFADEAWYSRPAGRELNEETGEWEQKNAEGFSIRFAEEAGRTMGNLLSDSQIVAETFEERLVHVWAMDLETNFTRGVTISVPKLVERKSLKKGQVPLTERTNSKGDKVYVVSATPAELNTTHANLVAKAERQCILKMLPAWIQAECKAKILETLAGEISKDPKAFARRIIDNFAELQVLPSDLQAFVGHTLDRLTEKELADLRNAYSAIKDGAATWDEVMEVRHPGSADAQADVAARKLEELRRQEAARKANAGATTPTEPAAAPAAAAAPVTGELSEDEHRRMDRQAAAEEQAPQQTQGFSFGPRRGR